MRPKELLELKKTIETIIRSNTQDPVYPDKLNSYILSTDRLVRVLSDDIVNHVDKLIDSEREKK